MRKKKFVIETISEGRLNNSDLNAIKGGVAVGGGGNYGPACNFTASCVPLTYEPDCRTLYKSCSPSGSQSNYVYCHDGGKTICANSSPYGIVTICISY